MVTVYKPQYYGKDKQGRRVRKKLKHWYVRYRDAAGNLVEKKGYTDKQATRQLGARLQRDAALKREGLIGPTDEHLKQPLTVHVEDYERYLRAKGNGDVHVTKTIGQIGVVIKDCRFKKLLDIQGAAVIECLARLRQMRPLPELLAGKEHWTAGELAELLGIRLASVHRLAKRGHVLAEGSGRDKRFPRSGVAELLRQRSQGIGIEQSNHYLTAFKGFTRWLQKENRLLTDPLVRESRLNPDTDKRHQRRALPDVLFGRFVDATVQGKGFRGLSGADRLILYTLAANTGLRASELGSLTPASFCFEGVTHSVTVAAGYSKHRQEDKQPLREDVADMMRQYLADRPSDKPVWPGTWTEAGAEMIKIDLQAAGIPYQDAGGRFFDFHALRGQFISMLALGGVHPKVAQELARHSTIMLTMDYYTHLDVLDVGGALNSLPKLKSRPGPSEAATGS